MQRVPLHEPAKSHCEVTITVTGWRKPNESERKLSRDVPIDQHHPVLRRTPMTVKTMEDLFVETLKDIYFAEKHILRALPE